MHQNIYVDTHKIYFQLYIYYTTNIDINQIITEDKTETRRDYQEATSKHDKRRARSTTPDHSRLTQSTPQASSKTGIICRMTVAVKLGVLMQSIGTTILILECIAPCPCITSSAIFD